MKYALMIALCATAGTVSAQPLSLTADAPDDRAGDLTQLRLRDQVIVEHAGATAAFSVDTSIAEVSARDGRVMIVARGVGSTTISIVTANEIVSIPLVVVAPPPWRVEEDDPDKARSWTLWSGQYESLTARLTNSIEVVDGNQHRTLRAYAVNVLRVDEIQSDDRDARTSVPALALEWRTKRREVVLFDKTIEHSQLTLDGVTVRGAHLREGGFELHAGVTSPVLYQNVFLANDGELVLGASYELRVGRSSFTPNLYAYPSTPTTGGSDGAMGSLLYRYHSRDDRLQLRTELGWGGELGAAGELTYQDPRNRAWLSARHQPRGFAALGIGRPLGSMFDGIWTAEPTKNLGVNVATTAAHYVVGEHEQDVVTAMIEARSKIATRLAASLGIGSGQYSGDTMPAMVRSITVPVGLHYDGGGIGASAIYRYQQNSARNLGGHGGRLSLRLDSGALHVSSFADVQQEAATIDVVLRAEPGLAQLLDELGLTANSPDDLARLLRENATLAQLGYTEDARLDFNPWRAQAGGELAWLTRDKTRHQLRLRALLNRTQTVTSQQQTASTSLSYARRFGRSIEAMGMLSWWSRTGEMSSRTDTWSIAAGMRVRFNSAPRLGGWRRRDLEGTVLSSSDEPVAGVTVRLDRRRTVTTDASGRFVFEAVAHGSHHVAAEAPDLTYFVSSSEVDVEAGEPVRFVIDQAPARLTGSVRDDTGWGIAGVVVVVRGATSRTATTNSTGRYQLAMPVGSYELAIAADSLPPGYDTSRLAPKQVALPSGPAVERSFDVRAHRSIAGLVHASLLDGGKAMVRLVELDLLATLDAEGRYVFRNLAPGRYSVELVLGAETRRRSIEVPVAPSALAGVDFAP